MKERAVVHYTLVLILWASGCLIPAGAANCQQAPPATPPAPAPAPVAAATGNEEDQPLPGDWAPELLDGILSSPNQEAQFNLLRAAFAAGPATIPQLAAALTDDRTAEFAAQSLAFIGGEQALSILAKLISDPRDLNLRRFTYGALGEYDSPQATNTLLDVISKSDSEPDRTVTEVAVIALTLRTDTTLLSRLQAIENKLQDVVIRDDLDNARDVIEARAKYLASPAGRKAGGSIEAAVRTYFIPALEPTPTTESSAAMPVSKSAGKTPAPAPHTEPRSMVNVEVRNVTLSPDKDRALARVIFEDPTATAYYDFVLQRHYGNWTVASVWLGPEIEKKAVGNWP